MTIEICCNRCKGTGRRRLSAHLMETLNIVSQLREVSVNEAHARTSDEVGVTALNNRLEDLREIGLLSRRRRGKEWLYSVVDDIDCCRQVIRTAQDAIEGKEGG